MKKAIFWGLIATGCLCLFGCGEGLDDIGGLQQAGKPEGGDPSGCPEGWAGKKCATFDEAQCSDGIDNDGDQLTDCQDSVSCGQAAVCQVPEICDDGIDNNHDLWVDCADSGCMCELYCQQSEVNRYLDCGSTWPVFCNDGIDNDRDGLTDFEDPDCLGY